MTSNRYPAAISQDLQSKGWQQVSSSGTNGQGGYPSNYTPAIGDVAVLPAGNGTGQYGHIQVYTPQGWVSDTIQSNATNPSNNPQGFWPSQSYKANGQVQILRNPQWGGTSV